MTYLIPATRRQSPMVRRYGRRRRGLNGLGALGSTDDCLEQSKTDAATFSARADEISNNWNPTGYYTATEIQQVAQTTFAVVNEAFRILDQADKEIPQRDWDGDPSAHARAIQSERDALLRINSEVGKFSEAITEATEKGIRIIDAPGLKRWVVRALYASASAIRVASFVGCILPWWVGALRGMAQFFGKLEEILRLIGRTLARVGETVLQVPDTLGTVLTVAKWSLIVGVPLYVIFKLNQAARGARARGEP